MHKLIFALSIAITILLAVSEVHYALARGAMASPIEIVDEFGTTLTDIRPGQLVLIEDEIVNGQNKKQAFAHIVQIRDQHDITISVSWVTGELFEMQPLKVSRSWTPDSAGDFTVEIFFWEGINNPNALGPTKQITVTVSL